MKFPTLKRYIFPNFLLLTFAMSLIMFYRPLYTSTVVQSAHPFNVCPYGSTQVREGFKNATFVPLHRPFISNCQFFYRDNILYRLYKLLRFFRVNLAHVNRLIRDETESDPNKKRTRKNGSKGSGWMFVAKKKMERINII